MNVRDVAANRLKMNFSDITLMGDDGLGWER